MFIKEFKNNFNEDVDSLKKDVEKITHKLGYRFTNIKYLHKGLFGYAFRLNDKKVIKITKDISEVNFALKIKEYGWSKYIVTVYDVLKVKDYYVII